MTAKHIQDITEYSGSAIEHSRGIIAFVPKGRTKIAQRFIAGKGLLSLPTTVSLAQAIQFIKGGSSKWVHDTFLEHNAFTWQEGYGAFSIGVSQVEDTVSYIASQAEHHRKRTFQEEFLAFLKRHGIAYDERYLWG
ncbi:MAG TPA: transposase [Thermoguttaceae bacterium]|nr:transposase [Thermoguttaceae bacterium]